MEHDWGRAVVEYGVSTLGLEVGGPRFGPVTLASRMLTGFPGRILTNLPTGLSNAVQTVILPNTADTQYFFGLVAKAGNQHFPYGYAVDPDAPV